MAARLENALQDAHVGLKVLQVLTENSYDSILVTDATKDAKIGSQTKVWVAVQREGFEI